ncbi:MAG: UDP-N-acetylmuramoyl-L-alanine--D-glutamate ligase, partial [Planctomycetes bacterium]|nr:UDP-N-acetylmuramoyl-L-alanine--D-glutamate ligase [Planctomycetota bacterium]
MRECKTDQEIANKRVTVMGLGRFGGGVGVARWLANNGAHVIVSDIAPAEKLANSIAALDGLDIEFHLGCHDEKDFTSCDLLVVNPAVPFDSPYLQIARKAGVKITTEINLFLSRCKGKIIGITGSAGKSTTASMIGA